MEVHIVADAVSSRRYNNNFVQNIHNLKLVIFYIYVSYGKRYMIKHEKL